MLKCLSYDDDESNDKTLMNLVPDIYNITSIEPKPSTSIPTEPKPSTSIPTEPKPSTSIPTEPKFIEEFEDELDIQDYTTLFYDASKLLLYDSNENREHIRTMICKRILKDKDLLWFINSPNLNDERERLIYIAYLFNHQSLINNPRYLYIEDVGDSYEYLDKIDTLTPYELSILLSITCSDEVRLYLSNLFTSNISKINKDIIEDESDKYSNVVDVLLGTNFFDDVDIPKIQQRIRDINEDVEVELININNTNNPYVIYYILTYGCDRSDKDKLRVNDITIVEDICTSFNEGRLFQYGDMFIQYIEGIIDKPIFNTFDESVLSMIDDEYLLNIIIDKELLKVRRYLLETFGINNDTKIERLKQLITLDNKFTKGLEYILTIIESIDVLPTVTNSTKDVINEMKIEDLYKIYKDNNKELFYKSYRENKISIDDDDGSPFATIIRMMNERTSIPFNEEIVPDMYYSNFKIDIDEVYNLMVLIEYDDFYGLFDSNIRMYRQQIFELVCNDEFKLKNKMIKRKVELSTIFSDTLYNWFVDAYNVYSRSKDIIIERISTYEFNTNRVKYFNNPYVELDQCDDLILMYTAEYDYELPFNCLINELGLYNCEPTNKYKYSMKYIMSLIPKYDSIEDLYISSFEWTKYFTEDTAVRLFFTKYNDIREYKISNIPSNIKNKVKSRIFKQLLII